LRLSITAVFSLAAVIALVPATVGRPKVSVRSSREMRTETGLNLD